MGVSVVDSFEGLMKPLGQVAFYPPALGGSHEFCRLLSAGSTGMSRETSQEAGERTEEEGDLFDGDDDFEDVSTFSEAMLFNAIEEAVSRSGLAVTISDPREEETKFKIVSDGFEDMSGYSRRELLGKDLRLLQSNSCCDDLQACSRLNLSNQTGAACSAELLLRRKTGEKLADCIHQRGLTIAFNPETGKKLWVLIAVHVDAGCCSPEPQSPEEGTSPAEALIEDIRYIVSRSLSAMASTGAHSFQSASREEEDANIFGPTKWHLLPFITWRTRHASLTTSDRLMTTGLMQESGC
ncbi:unnamed protein product [Polarella glacialis]|uniref:PAS domain-containing protein n=1 Tax=Polarella glacialis TaxID=89957 RepID=A0A813L6G4_POLGL|nr:unnamed protein product [Polarella glacialis]